jgi:hypothetical protein
MRSTLIQKGVLINAETDPQINLEPEDARITDMLTEISQFFTVTVAKEGAAVFSELYDILTKHENGFGLKLGVVPIYIALVLHLYKKNLVILYRGGEVKITPELLNDINESPDEYSVIIEDWNDDKASYMAQLEAIFSEFVTEREKAYNSFTYLVLAMNRWYLSLPKFAKETTHFYQTSGEPQKINPAQRKFIGCLKQLDVNPREFLFEKVFDIFEYKAFTLNVVDNISRTKQEYDAAVKHLIEWLNGKIRAMFSTRKSKGSLTSVIKDWFETLNERTRQQIFSGNESKILALMESVTNDESAFVQRLAKAVTFLRLDDWNSNMADSFLKELKAFKKTVEDFNNRRENTGQGVTSYEIIFTDAKGARVPKRFDKMEYSDRAKLLHNEISTALEEMGQSITEQEKRQVLIELLEKLC